MSVERALRDKSPLRLAVKPGKRGMRKADRERIVEERVKVIDSLEIDELFAATLGNEHRWDYIVGTSALDRPVIAVEVHPANAKEAATIVAKCESARRYLQLHLREGSGAVRRWYWIASGRTTLSRTSSEYRLLAKKGIELVGSHLRL